MTKVMIRVDAEISDELSSAFPHLTPRWLTPRSGASAQPELEHFLGTPEDDEFADRP